MNIYLVIALFFILLITILFISRFKLSYSLVIIVLCIILLRFCFFQINQGTQVAITQFGKVIANFTEPGLYLRIPILWQTHYMDSRIFTTEDVNRRLITHDGALISIDSVILWKITNPGVFLTAVEDNYSEAEDFLRNIVSGNLRSYLSKYSLSEITHRNPGTYQNESDSALTPLIKDTNKIMLGREQLLSSIVKNSIVNSKKLGVTILAIYITNIRYSPEVEPAIYQRMSQQSLREAAKYIAAGTQKAKIIQGKTLLATEKIIAPAQKEADIIKGKADAKVAEIYGKVLIKDPGFFNFWKTLYIYDQSLPRSSKSLIFSMDSPIMKYLKDYPLDGKDYAKNTKGEK
jgi:membrane protease subunit HflC